MRKEEDLESRFDTLLENEKPEWQNFGGVGAVDMRATRAVALLGKSVVKLDRTSGRLAKINIFLGVVLAAIGMIQIVLMVLQR